MIYRFKGDKKERIIWLANNLVNVYSVKLSDEDKQMWETVSDGVVDAFLTYNKDTVLSHQIQENLIKIIDKFSEMKKRAYHEKIAN